MTSDATPGQSFRVVILASGAGSTMQSLLDAAAAPGSAFAVAAVGADRDGCGALERARAAGVPTFVVRVRDFDDRPSWDGALARAVGVFRPDLVVSAGFMKLVGPQFLAAFPQRYVNSHPALLPAFPGMHGPRDALDHGVKVTGATLFVVDEGVDTGPILDQRAVLVDDDDTVESLHQRIKDVERDMLVSVVGRMAQVGWTVDGRKVTFG